MTNSFVLEFKHSFTFLVGILLVSEGSVASFSGRGGNPEVSSQTLGSAC